MLTAGADVEPPGAEVEVPEPLPLPEPEPDPVLFPDEPDEPEPELEEEPGARFCVAFAASAAKAWTVLAPDWALDFMLVFVRSSVRMWRRRDLRVDGADHARLAMLALRAVEPDGACAVHDEGVGGELGRARGDLLEAGEEARGVRHDVIDGDAGLGEGGLGDGVVLSSSTVRGWYMIKSKLAGRYLHLPGTGTGPYRPWQPGCCSGCTSIMCRYCWRR